MPNLTTYIMAVLCLIAGFAVGSVALPVPETEDQSQLDAANAQMIAMAERIEQIEADLYRK